jgi:hypothetical protein
MKRRKPKAQPDPAKVKICLGFFLQGAAVDDVFEKCRELWPGIPVEPIVAEVFETFRKSGERPPAVVLGWCLECARELYLKMLEVGDFAGALNALKEIPKIHAKTPKAMELPEAGAEIGNLKL